MQSLRQPNTVPIPGYRLVTRLGAGGFGEVWKCEAPGGLYKAIKFVSGQGGDGPATDADKELRALALLKSINHPYLLSIERIETLPGGDLAIVSELAECSLHDVLTQHRAAGQTGVPRADALAYLHEAAEVLDLISHEHGLQHLDIKPRNLFLVQKHVKVGDFGMVASLADHFGKAAHLGLSGVTPLYAAPEVFQARVTLFTDQFSLAITYHELLTGEVVFNGGNLRAQMLLVATQEPDLSRLPEGDRPVVARALSKEPRDRFPSCTAFIEALPATPSGRHLRSRTTSFDLPAVQLSPGPSDGPATAPPRAPGETAVVAAVGGATRAVARPAASPSPPAELLPGVQLLECLQRGPHGEWWRAAGPRGGARMVRFLSTADGESTDDLVARLLAFDHPSLAELEALPAGPGRLALVSEAGDQSLAGLLRNAQSQARVGLSRPDVLNILGPVASALDELHGSYRHQHLLLSPRHIVVSRGSAVLLEYGLAALCWAPRGLPLAEINPRYAAAELFGGEASPASDQYSLALIYAELVLGLHPFRNLNARQMLTARNRSQPDLSLLPSPERAALAKALQDDPARRFARCADLVEALREGAGLTPRAQAAIPPTSRVILAARPPAEASASAAVLEGLIARAGRGHEVRGGGGLYYLVTPTHRVEHRGKARLLPGLGRLKLTAFRERWQAEALEIGAAGGAFLVRRPVGLWRRLLGQAPGLRVEVSLGVPHETFTPVRATLAAVGCSGAKAAALLDELGPPVLASLQTYLGSQSTQAEQERYPADHEVSLRDPVTGLHLPGRLRDLGRDGLAVFVPVPVPPGSVTVALTVPGTAEVLRLAGRACDCLRREGTPPRYEVEVSLQGLG